MGSWGSDFGGMGSERLRVRLQGHGRAHHFCICCCGELCERKEVEFWRLRQSLIDSIFSTGRRVKGEYGGVLCDPYFERI